MPGLPAKPVIDIDVVVAGTMVAAGAGVLSSLGFTALGQLGIPQRWAFKQPPDLDATNTYIIVAKSLSLRNHLALRDTLRAAGLRPDKLDSINDNQVPSHTEVPR